MSVQINTAGARSVLLNVQRGLQDLSLVRQKVKDWVINS